MTSMFLDESMYKRHLDPLKDYFEQASLFLSITNGISLQEAKEFVTKTVSKGGEYEFKDAPYHYLEKQENGDRLLKQSTVSSFINEVNKNNWVLAPSMTAYSDPLKHESPYVTYMRGNIKKRKLFKNKMFACKTNKDFIGQNFNNNLQTSMKLDNNACSGAQSVASTALVNKTAHPTLTSICRITTAFGSGHCERLISGMRLYFSLDVAMANVVSIIQGTDFVQFEAFMLKYKLHYPTVEQTIAVIERSSKQYTSSKSQWVHISQLIQNMTPLQRAAFCYTGDMYHLRLFNENFVREFLTDLCRKAFYEESIEGVQSKIHKIEETIIIHARQVCTLETQGKGGDLSKLSEQDLRALYGTALWIQSVLSQYELLIKTLFINKNVPSYVAHFPDAVRQCVLGGDTDSTFYTTQEWIQWYKGDVLFDQTFISICSAVVFINSATLKHILALFSSNLGTDPKERYRISMKNEYRFDVFVPTQLGKHYYADKGCQEGNVFEEPDYEFKGANLISNSAPTEVINANKEIMIGVTKDVKEKGKIDVFAILQKVADVEKNIIASISKAQIQYLRTGKIKAAASYKNAENTAAFKQHLFWDAVFAPKYGKSDTLPYATVKISTTTEKPVDTIAWIDAMQDRELAERLVKWLKENGRDTLDTFTMPLSVLSTSGIPTEIKQVINYRRIVYSACTSMYLVLESLGIYITDQRTKTLVIEWLGGNIQEHVT